MNFEEIFKEQLASNKPYTRQQIDFIIKSKTQKMPIKELAKIGSYLKSKIGKQRLDYAFIPLGSTKVIPETEKVWSDELDTLVQKLNGLVHVGYADKVPIFKKPDISTGSSSAVVE